MPNGMVYSRNSSLPQPASFHILEFGRKAILLVGMGGIDQHHPGNFVAIEAGVRRARRIHPSNGRPERKAARHLPRASSSCNSSAMTLLVRGWDWSRCSRVPRGRRSRRAQISRFAAALCARKRTYRPSPDSRITVGLPSPAQSMCILYPPTSTTPARHGIEAAVARLRDILVEESGDREDQQQHEQIRSTMRRSHEVRRRG